MSASEGNADIAKSMSVPDFRVHALVLCPFTALNHDLAYVRLIDARLFGHVAFTWHSGTAHAAFATNESVLMAITGTDSMLLLTPALAQ